MRSLLELSAKVHRKVHVDGGDSDSSPSIIICDKHCDFCCLWVGLAILDEVATLEGSRVPRELPGLLPTAAPLAELGERARLA